MTKKENMEKIKAFNAQQAQNALATQQQIDDADKTSRQQIQQKAKEEKLTQEEIDEQKAKLQEEEVQREADTLQQLTDATSTLIDRVNTQLSPFKSWLASQPTPGGIGALLIFIGFMALVTIPVNSQGQTRAFLFWQTLMNRTHMKYRENTTVGGQASGNFGGPSSPSDTSSNSNGSNSGYTGLAPVDVTHLNILGF